MQEEVLPLKKVAEAMGAEALLIDHRHPMATLCLAYNHTHAGMPHSRTPAYWHTYCVAQTPMAYAVISNHWHRYWHTFVANIGSVHANLVQLLRLQPNQLSAVSNMFQHQTPDQTSAPPVAWVTTYMVLHPFPLLPRRCDSS